MPLPHRLCRHHHLQEPRPLSLSRPKAPPPVSSRAHILSIISTLGFAAREGTPMESVPVCSCSSPPLAEAGDVCGLRSSSTAATRRAAASSRRFAPAVRCSSRGDACIPKLEPFSRTRLERGLKEPPLIQKCENELVDYCSTLEGDSSYSCWRAYFELKDLEVGPQISSPQPPSPEMPF